MSVVATSLNAVTGIATGSVIQYDEPKRTFTVQVNPTTFTGGTVTLKGSLDGQNYFGLGGEAISANGGFFHVEADPSAGYTSTRVDFSNATGTGTLTAIVAAAD